MVKSALDLEWILAFIQAFLSLYRCNLRSGFIHFAPSSGVLHEHVYIHAQHVTKITADRKKR